jgi:hypothetical protein
MGNSLQHRLVDQRRPEDDAQTSELKQYLGVIATYERTFAAGFERSWIMPMEGE